MQINARASHISHSPRKVNLVAKTIVGLPAEKALEKLQFTLKRASSPVAKVLKQAIGNAVANYHVDSKTLIIERAYATKGRVRKSGHFGARGRFKPFERTASHLTIILKSVTPKAAPATKKTETPPITNKLKPPKRPKILKS
jgi:large subunit ribosomal protein L22